MQSMLNSLQNGMQSFIFTTLLVHTISATISTKDSSSFSFSFHLPISLLLVHKIILTMPTSTLLLIQAASKDQGARVYCKKWHSFYRSHFFLQSMNSDNRDQPKSLIFCCFDLKIWCIACVANEPIHLLSDLQPIVTGLS